MKNYRCVSLIIWYISSNVIRATGYGYYYEDTSSTWFEEYISRYMSNTLCSEVINLRMTVWAFSEIIKNLYGKETRGKRALTS